MSKEKQIDIVSRYHAKNDLANALYLKQDEFDLSNPFEVANCVINLGYRKITENEVVISKEEWKRIKSSLYYSKEELEKKLDKARNETAEKILKGLYCLPHEYHENEIEELAKEFGVDLGE